MAKKEDKRAYFKVDIGYLSNPKIAELMDETPRAVLLHLQCIAYSAQHLTDGVVPMRLAMRLACSTQSDLDACLNAGLLRRVNATHLEVHDYLLHQRSAASVKGQSEKAKHAAQARWEAEKTDASSNADRMQDAMQREERENYSSPIAAAIPDQPRDDVERLCARLASCIENNGVKRPTIGKAWRDSARLLMDKDGHTEQQIAWVIDWATSDDFWRANILSMPTLRAKFDQLVLKARGSNVTPLRTDSQGRPVLPPLPSRSPWGN